MNKRFAACLLSVLSALAVSPADAAVLAKFDDISAWQLVTSPQVSGSLRPVAGNNGRALCLDYNFHEVSGYVGIRRKLDVTWPENYQVSFDLRGDSPANDLQFKLIDASGDNVWWVNRPGYQFPKNWTRLDYRKRHIDKAWGPDPDRVLRRSAAVEFTIYSKVGGKGTVCFDRLAMQPLPREDNSPLTATVIADTATALQQRIADGKADTFWVSGGVKQQTVSLDLGKVRELGGAVVQWLPGLEASHYLVQGSRDGREWQRLREVNEGTGGTDWLALPETEARYLRFDLMDGPSWRYGIRDISLKPLSFAATPNDFMRSIAADLPRGSLPRGFSGEQPYWTLLGLDGGREQALMGEDGAVEAVKSGFSIEPFVLLDGKRISGADVKISQSLLDGYLPMPSVQWQHDRFRLQISSFVQGSAEQAQLVTRYRIQNPDKMTHEYKLALAVRPFQVNPPSQFLNTVGGVSRIEQVAVQGRQVQVNGKPRVFLLSEPDAAFATSFEGKLAVTHLADTQLPQQREAKDEEGLASAAMIYTLKVGPGGTGEVVLVQPQTGEWQMPAKFDVDKAEQQVAAMWRQKLDQVKLQVPEAGQPLADTLRTALAHMLISRVGPSLQPGTRSYARSWIRDGAMISEGLLRMGRDDAVRQYVEWYAPYQFESGMVPCCVDARGSDPVPENDSHGELIYNIAEYWRHTGDTAFLQAMWPHVQGAWRYMEQLRLSERTEENRARHPGFYGMMPVSISHEGYSAKPVHSYWDDFWSLRGYKDAADIATALGLEEDAAAMAASRDEFRQDLDDSLRATMQAHAISYLPGSVELGDFDPTSTTIALAPGGEQGRLPQPALNNTFERYWSEFVQRRDGKRQWKDYTPYEWRNVAAFVRLGWRARAWEATEFFFKDRAPQGWNQWAEVVSSTPRKPFFVGDLPHAWVASDFVRSALDMFAYQREVDDAIVLAAGVPSAWLSGKGVSIDGLHTAHGTVKYTLSRSDRKLSLRVPEGLQLPSGGLVLPWPYEGAPGAATINGEQAQWQDNELRITSLPARVEIEVPAEQRRSEREKR